MDDESSAGDRRPEMDGTDVHKHELAAEMDRETPPAPELNAQTPVTVEPTLEFEEKGPKQLFLAVETNLMAHRPWRSVLNEQS